MLFSRLMVSVYYLLNYLVACKHSRNAGLTVSGLKLQYDTSCLVKDSFQKGFLS